MKKPISQYHVELGRNIQNFRKEHQLTLQEFSRLADIEAKKMRHIERGAVNFRLTTLMKLIQVMGQSLFYK